MTEQKPRKQRRWRRLAHVGLGVLVLALLFAAGGILIRIDDERAVAKRTDTAAVSDVDVINPRPESASTTLLLPGDVEAWFTAPIYAQVSGYLLMWYKDIGAVVKAGDVLGEIATPSLDQELRQTRAALQQAIANQQLAEVTARRWEHLLPTQAVSQQSTDIAVADAAVKRAATAAAQANVERLQALEEFKKLVAPFDGVVTVRRADVGALIKADNVPGPELFAVADIHAMRAYVKVPQAYASQIRIGMKARLTLPEYPDRAYPATLITTAHAINLESRTLLVELEATNPHGELSPGSYANVEFELPPDPRALLLPTTALIFQEDGMQVATVGADDKVRLKNIRIARDLGTEVEVVAGLERSDEVIDQPPDNVLPGEKVRVVGHHRAPPMGQGGKQAPVPGT